MQAIAGAFATRVEVFQTREGNLQRAAAIPGRAAEPRGVSRSKPEFPRATVEMPFGKPFLLWTFCTLKHLKPGMAAAMNSGLMYGKGNGNQLAPRSVKSGSARWKSVAQILRSSYRRYVRDPFADVAVNSVLGKAGMKRGG